MKILLQQISIMLLAIAAVSAQSVSGTLSGKVLTAAGTGVPNAAVTVTNTGTNVSQKVLTGPDGSFSIAGLPPGTYRVDVETTGYKRTSQQNIELTTTGPATVSITLEAGNVNESVEIKGSSPAVQERDAETSIALGTRTVRELPVIDRNYQQLVGLQTGVTPPQPALDLARDPARNRFYSANGQSPFLNEYYLDGVSNREPFRGTAIRVHPEETVQQLNIVTATHAADKGFTPAAWVSPITRGGTNDWHGALFEFYSGNVLRARNFFNTAGNPDPRFVHNQFGADFGGPIARDRTFFFGSYEGMFDNGASTQLTTVPTAAAVAGNFSGIPGVTIYNPLTGTLAGTGRSPIAGGRLLTSMINPTAAAIASYIPAPNLPGFFDNYVTNVPFQNHEQKADFRIDQHFSDRTSAFLRYGYSNDWSFDASPLGNVIGGTTRGRLVAQNAVADLAHEFGPRLITDFRFGYNRWDQKIRPWGDQTVLARSLGLTNFNNNLIGININGLAPIGAPSYVPENAIDNTFNWVWTWGLHTSMHNVKFGVDVRRIRSDGFTDTMFGSMFGPNGTAFFGPGATMLSGGAVSPVSSFYNAFASFLLGAPNQVGVTNFLGTPTIRQTVSGVWFGDKIQLMRRVTLDLGVRYELYSPLEPRRAGGAAFFNPANNTFNFAGLGNVPMRWGFYDTDNVAPRIGLAFRLTNRTVIRGGYGINYFQMPYMLSGFMAPITGSVSGVQGGFTVAPFSGRFGPTVSSTTPAPGTLQNGAAAGNLPATVLPRYVENPYVQTFSFQFQQDFYAGTMLSIGYVGALDRHLPYIQELNAAMPGMGVAGLPFFSLQRTASTLAYNTGLTSNYNSLQTSLSKRFSREGLSFLGSYTWSRALGYTGNNGLLLNPFNLHSNYGPLDFDRQHVLTISHLWELPGYHGNNLMETILGGWQLNGIFTWATGAPLTITSDPVACACPGATLFASLNGTVSPFATTGGGAVLNPAAFSSPAPGQFGNLTRGTLRAPGFRNYDMSLFKDFRVRDRFNLEFRGEAYNLTNTPHFAAPVSSLSSPDFGRTVSTVNGGFGRQVNLGVRLMF